MFNTTLKRPVQRVAKFGDASSFRDVRFTGTGLVANDAIGWFGLSGSSIASSIRSWLTAHGWGVGTIIVSEISDRHLVDIALTVSVACDQNLNDVGYRLFQTIAGSTTGWGIGLVNIFGSTNFLQATEQQSCPQSQSQQGGGGGSSSVSTYTVVSGDTLLRIAARFGLTLQQILALNPQITNPNVIHVGQVINIVRGSNTQPTTNTNPATQPATQPANNNTPLPPRITGSGQNWFDKTFFTGAGALSGAAIGVLIVLGTVVFIKTTRG